MRNGLEAASHWRDRSVFGDRVQFKINNNNSSILSELKFNSVHLRDIKEDFNKKNSKKSDIVTIRSETYLPYLNSDIKISDICSKTLYLPTRRK